jgi:hypothetical protein
LLIIIINFNHNLSVAYHIFQDLHFRFYEVIVRNREGSARKSHDTAMEEKSMACGTENTSMPRLNGNARGAVFTADSICKSSRGTH